MAWLNYPLRRMMVAAALLALFVTDVSLMAVAATSDFTAAEQANTLKFLQGLAASNPSLATIWSGTDFCKWSYVSCSTYSGATLDFSRNILQSFTGSLTLHDISDDVDGSAVIFTDIRLSGMGQRVSGTLPASWGRLTRVQTLYLNGNALTGTLPPAWKGMTALYTLRLESSGLEGTLPGEWRFLSTLDELRLTNNTLSGTLPAAWSRMTSLSTLYLNDNTFSGTLPAAWSSASNLRYVYMSNNQLTGEIPTQWGDMSVRNVDLSKNSLCGCLPAKWKSSYYPSATVDPAVSASDCATANVCVAQGSESGAGNDDSADEALLTTSELNTLRFLQLVGAAMGGDLQSSWSGVWYCSWPSVSCAATGLATVALSNVALASAVQLPELTEDIDGALVDVTSFSLYGKGASVTGTLPASWGRLVKLQSVLLYGNALTGTLPSAWGGMTALRTLRLEKNTLSGTLPDVWTSMAALQTLNLGDSLYSGTLPAVWGSLTNLQYVTLNNNKLEGSIPAAWTGMSSLRTLNLEDNALCGCVPDAWKNSYAVSVYADDAVTATTCATTNACDVQTNESSSSTTTKSEEQTDDSSSSTTTTTEEQTNTLKFLRAFTTMDASLAEEWTGMDYCSWSHVSCATDGSVQLDLSGRALGRTAALPALALNGAVQLDVSVQAVTRTATLPELPADVKGSLVAMTSLIVQGKGTSVTGTLPASWGSLTRLETLNVSNNGIKGTLPSAWSGMGKLSTLDVSGNALSGAVPASWGALTKLSRVVLTGTGLCGCLPEEWAGKMVTADDAVSGSDCATANACAAETSAPEEVKKKSGPNLIPLWCVLGALGGLLVGLAVGLSVRFYRRRQREEEEAKRFEGAQGRDEEPFAQTPDSPY